MVTRRAPHFLLEGKAFAVILMQRLVKAASAAQLEDHANVRLACNPGRMHLQ
jgi:hypothetical protein